MVHGHAASMLCCHHQYLRRGRRETRRDGECGRNGKEIGGTKQPKLGGMSEMENRLGSGEVDERIGQESFGKKTT